jgi:RimJ/RimL family protein N-acetyltransferase
VVLALPRPGHPGDWTLLLGIWHQDQFIGCQDISAKDFATLKTVSTGSWLRQSVHGQGLGTEMRAAVGLYAFGWLGAEIAESEATAWNAVSLGVSRSLGYEPRPLAQDGLDLSPFEQFRDQGGDG